MRVLVLSWDASAADGGLDPQAAGLAAALAADGDDVRLITRLGEDLHPPEMPGVEVHAVTDAPPIIPVGLDGPLLAAQAFAARATSVAVRRLRERDVDVVHAVGWQTQPVVAAVRATHATPAPDVTHATSGPPVAAVLTRAELAPAVPAAIRATAHQLASDAAVVLAPTTTDQRALRAVTGREAGTLIPGTDVPPRAPGPPPAAGPLHLVAGPAHDHRVVARQVRDAAFHPRRITRSWRRRPFAVAVLDPDDVTTALRALALGVPLLAVDGPVGEVAAESGGGLVVAPDATAVAAAADRLTDDADLAAALGAAGAAAAVHHAWPAVVTAWRSAVAPVMGAGHAPTRLHAAG